MKVAHLNLFTFLGHLKRTTTDSEADIFRLNRGMAIRRAKKRSYIINDNRIKTRLRRFDDNSYTRMQFLQGVSGSCKPCTSYDRDVCPSVRLSVRPSVRPSVCPSHADIV